MFFYKEKKKEKKNCWGSRTSTPRSQAREACKPNVDAHFLQKGPTAKEAQQYEKGGEKKQ